MAKLPTASTLRGFLWIVLGFLLWPSSAWPQEPAGRGPASGIEDTSLDSASLDNPGGERTVIERRIGQGEQCLVCRQRIYGAEIVEVRYQGRTFHLAAKMLEDFDRSPDLYFQALEARSGLFDEQSISPSPLTKGWLLLGSYMVLGLVSAALCGYLAISRGLAPLPWFFAGLVGNVAALGLLFLTSRGEVHGIPAGLAKLSSTPLPQPCPGCTGFNHPAAPACSICGMRLQPTQEAERARI